MIGPVALAVAVHDGGAHDRANCLLHAWKVKREKGKD
jgi:hypothetical protein